MLEQVQDELKKQTEVLQQVLQDKEKEIKTVKDQLCHAKENAIQEYRDSEAYLTELDGTYADNFNDCLRQVKASFPDLDLVHVSIDAQAQTPTQLVHFEGTNKLFANDALVDDATVDLRGDRDAAPGEQQKTIEEGTR